MQASTWQLMSRSAASAAISATGSMTPCGYCGAEATTRTVLSSMAAAIASTSARQSGSHWDPAALEAEVVGALLERGVGRGGQHDVGPLDPALGPAPLAGGLDGEEDALGPAGRHEAGGVGTTVQPSRHDVDDVLLHATQAREGVGVQGVLGHVPAVGLLGHGLDLRPRGVGERQGPAVPPADVASPQVLEPGQHLIGRLAVLWQRRSHGGAR